MQKQYITEFAVAEMLSLNVQSLRNQRHEGRGLPYIKFGKAVRYCVEDVERYLESCRIMPRQGVAV